MNILVILAIGCNVVAVLCLAAPVITYFIPGRLALQWRRRHWSGDEVSSIESRRLNGRITTLRICAGVSLAVAVVLWIALYTVLAYRAT